MVHSTRHIVRNLSVGLIAALMLLMASTSHAQVVQQAIGGVLIDAEGMLRQSTIAEKRALFDQLRNALGEVPGDLRMLSDLRKVSLRQLDATIREAISAGREMPDEVRYLGGLLRVEYVLVYPEDNDIVLAGPGDAWTVSPAGSVVGQQTGQPVVLLDDLLVALRTTKAAREVGISCSIDPTAEGRQACEAFFSRQKNFHPAMVKAVEDVIGPQEISITGVPAESHFARVLVACDYRMKCFAMHLENAPVDDLPSFLTLLRTRRGGVSSLMPRWWLACDYQPLHRSEDGLAWQLQGTGVKAMTEDQLIRADGSVEQTGRANVVAQEWADRMTVHYQELAAAEPIFGQLRNVMDLCVVAALIEKEHMRDMAGCQLSCLLGEESDGLVSRWNVPRTVPTQGSFIKKGRNYIITASGGVQIDPWHYASMSKVDTHVVKVREQAAAKRHGWRWD